MTIIRNLELGLDPTARELTDKELRELLALADSRYLPSELVWRKVLHTALRRGRWTRSLVEVWPVTVAPLASRRQTMKMWVLEPATVPWVSQPITDDSSADLEVDQLLAQHGALDERDEKHQTSVQPVVGAKGNYRMDVYVVVVPLDGPILRQWPTAEPVTNTLLERWGPPPPHGGMELPRVPAAHRFTHGLGHIAERLGPHGDAGMKARLVPLGVDKAVKPFKRTLFRQFQVSYEPELDEGFDQDPAA